MCENSYFTDKSFLGVYTKNRNFRMYLSTKQGKKSPLVLSSCNKYVPLVHPEYRKEALFYDSLVTYFRYCNNLIIVKNGAVYFLLLIS